MLFGSQARGDAGEDSDNDIAVFLKDLKEGDLDTRWRELDRLADLRSAILSDTEAFIEPSRTRPAPTEIEPHSWERSGARASICDWQRDLVKASYQQAIDINMGLILS